MMSDVRRKKEEVRSKREEVRGKKLIRSDFILFLFNHLSVFISRNSPFCYTVTSGYTFPDNVP